MAVKLRLRRVGATKRPSYRLVVADSRSPRNGRFVETVGHYNPLPNPEEIVIKTERVHHWLRQGAQPTDSVVRLLRKTGIIPSAPSQVAAVRDESATKTPES